MTDQELLEYAAKAVDYGICFYGECWRSQTGCEWNPLTSDADAFRLMCDLGIDVEWRADGRVSAYRHANSNGYCFTAFESSREDRTQNTRRAIVRAAAEIGRNMSDG